MKYSEELIKAFRKVNIDFSGELLDIISTKTDDGKVFPPYIPFIGKEYSKFKILVYSTAQNIALEDGIRIDYQKNFDKLVERLTYTKEFQHKYPSDEFTFGDIDIRPYQTGVLAALLGVFIYTKFGVKINDLDSINDVIAISNYYKFSLHSGKRDINPESGLYKYKNVSQTDKEHYWRINDELVKKEIEILKPDFILSFRCKKIRMLKENNVDAEVITINDPSWILRGGGGVFSENGSWKRKADKVSDANILELTDKYIHSISGKYFSRKEVNIYLLRYFSKWVNS